MLSRKYYNSIMGRNKPRWLYGCRVIQYIIVSFLNFLKVYKDKLRFLLFGNPNTTKLVSSIAGANLQNDFTLS